MLRKSSCIRSPWLCLDGTEPGSPGNIYFARFYWDEHDMNIITTLQQNITHQSTCMKMLSVKIGCSANIIRGTDDEDDDEDDDSDDDNDSNDGHTVEKRWRGCQFVTFTSQLTITVKAFKCSEMLREERELHNQNYVNRKWVQSGEWFNLNDAEVTAQIQPRTIIETTWERQRSGRRSCYYEDEVFVWVYVGIIEEWEMQDWTADGKIRHREEE